MDVILPQPIMAWAIRLVKLAVKIGNESTPPKTALTVHHQKPVPRLLELVDLLGIPDETVVGCSALSALSASSFASRSVSQKVPSAARHQLIKHFLDHDPASPQAFVAH